MNPKRSDEMINLNTFSTSITFLCLVISLFIMSHSFALEISPLTLELKSDSRPQYQQIFVRNPSNKTVPVEINLNQIVFDPASTGNSFSLLAVENDSELLVFPPALVLEPGEVKSVRVQWIGTHAVKQSVSYFVRFSQPSLSLPMSEDNSQENTQSGVKVFVHFNAVVHLSANDLLADLAVVEGSIEFNEQEHKLAFDVKNNGQRYSYLKPYHLAVVNSDGSTTPLLNEAAFSQLGDIFFPPQMIKKVSIPYEKLWVQGTKLKINNSQRD